MPANHLGPGWRRGGVQDDSKRSEDSPYLLREPTQKERGIIAVRCAVD